MSKKSYKKSRSMNYQAWEYCKDNDPFTRITRSMHDSDAYQDISIHARQLYFEMKYFFNGQDKEIIFPYSYAAKIMSKKAFSNSLDQLISHGFISITYEGKPRREANKYGFVGLWKQWPNITTEARSVRKAEKSK